jgi:hypothetical protein
MEEDGVRPARPVGALRRLVALAQLPHHPAGGVPDEHHDREVPARRHLDQDRDAREARLFGELQSAQEDGKGAGRVPGLEPREGGDLVGQDGIRKRGLQREVALPRLQPAVRATDLHRDPAEAAVEAPVLRRVGQDVVTEELLLDSGETGREVVRAPDRETAGLVGQAREGARHSGAPFCSAAATWAWPKPSPRPW